MAEYITIDQSLRGPAGADSTVPGPQGAKGDTGPQGPQGLPGVNAVANDTATAGYVADENSQTHAALNAENVAFAAGDDFTEGMTREQAYAALRAQAGALHAETGETYRIIACPLRNEGSPDYWQPIEDADHAPQYIFSVTTDGTEIIVYHAGSTAKVVSAFVVPDETLAQRGIFSGASVATGNSRIRLAQSLQAVIDYIYWDGSAFVASNGKFTTSWDGTNSILTLSHAAFYDYLPSDHYMCVNLTPRGRAVMPVIAEESSGGTPPGGTSKSDVRIKFANTASSFALITSPSTNCRFYVQHGTEGRYAVDPREIDTTKFPNSNLWYLALVQD